MSTIAPINRPAGRLATLLTLLDSDPGNVTLLADAAETALDEREPALASTLLERLEVLAPLSPPQCNLAGLAAMQTKDFEAASSRFRQLVDDGVEDPAVRFNLAWSLAMLKDFSGAAELLDEAVTTSLPQAATLRVQLLHEQALFDEAATEARIFMEIHPDHEGLMAAVSVLALDIDDEALAFGCAKKAANHPDALATLGMLALGEDRVAEALEIFDRALARGDDKPRAWVGRGLSKLLTDDSASAAADLDRGAELFEDHLGSWIAAGWARFINGDLEMSRDRFETAMELDPNFAETHGSLAVLDLLSDNLESAGKRSEMALRLDRQSYAGALAKSLLAAHSGNEKDAKLIFESALRTPIGEGGRTIAQALAHRGLR